jgi:hypothetical protein
MKVSLSAACITGASACALGVPTAAFLSSPGLALLFLLGVSTFGLVLFVLDMRG